MGEAITAEVVKQILDAKVYVVMMDETRDLSHKDEVIVAIQYIQQNADRMQVQERFLTLVDTDKKTGEGHEKLLLNVLEENSLDVNNIVGQCYDGGSNLSGIYEDVQAKICAKNENAVFTHCYAHSLNRAVVNAMNNRNLPEPRSFFSILELLVTFIKSGLRIQYFLKAQSDLLKGTKQSDSATNLLSAESFCESLSSHENRPLAPGVGICDTRWDVRASTLHRYTKPIVLKETKLTLDHVIETSNDLKARATAVGLKQSISEPKFLLLLCAFRPVLSAVNVVSKFLQSVEIDISSATEKVEYLKSEIRLLRSDSAWANARKEAENLAPYLDVNITDEIQDAEEKSRSRKKPRRIDEHPESQVLQSPLDSLRTEHYFQALDKLITELEKRFPNELSDLKYLQPNNYFVADAEKSLEKLSKRFLDHLNPEEAMHQWQIIRHTPHLQNKSVVEICSLVPDNYSDLKMLYKIFLMLPVTTSSLERGFSKLPIVKNKLRTTMTQDRLETLMFAAVEGDIARGLKMEDFVVRRCSAA